MCLHGRMVFPAKILGCGDCDVLFSFFRTHFFDNPLILAIFVMSLMASRFVCSAETVLPDVAFS